MKAQPNQVFVGLSGGVDSAVTLALLQKEAAKLNLQPPKAIFMRNWSKDLPGFQCPWAEDWYDAQSIALSLGLPIELWDFEKDYKDKVVSYLISEYQAGRTPNPDLICNQEIKFKVFLDQALQNGAEQIATGHYARIHQDSNNVYWLQMAKDLSKDQSYFLARISQEALQKTVFPLGDLLKSEVRQLATELRLPVASKKDSVGICFVGDIGIADFLKNFIELSVGPIIDTATNQQIGTHQGSQLYTIGQRHGLNLSSNPSGAPYYVVAKDTKLNTVYVSSVPNSAELFTKAITLTDCHLPSTTLDQALKYNNLSLRTRHLGKLEDIAQVTKTGPKTIQIKLSGEVKSPAPGQAGVIYTKDGLVLLAGFIA
jgi:tRNA-specific 2-thiouridylase